MSHYSDGVIIRTPIIMTLPDRLLLLLILQLFLLSLLLVIIVITITIITLIIIAVMIIIITRHFHTLFPLFSTPIPQPSHHFFTPFHPFLSLPTERGGRTLEEDLHPSMPFPSKRFQSDTPLHLAAESALGIYFQIYILQSRYFFMPISSLIQVCGFIQAISRLISCG